MLQPCISDQIPDATAACTSEYAELKRVRVGKLTEQQRRVTTAVPIGFRKLRQDSSGIYNATAIASRKATTLTTINAERMLN